jgi:L-alanine-DL-glutamate epimerase-like enolase superfamily enzyme
MPGLVLVRVHTDSGLVGHGESYYAPHAIAALIHDWMARRLIGSDALAIENHWRFFYERCTAFGVRGAELRAISAIDLALWDLLGQAAELPVYRLLGGPVRESIPVYNTCGGPSYGARQDRDPGWPGHGDEGQPGLLEDAWASLHAAGDLAEELLDEGIMAMKLWPFDRAAIRNGGHYLSWQDLEEGLRPLKEIRERVGMRIEIIIEGHAFFHLPAALRIAEGLKEIRPLWLEDVVRVDNVDTLADFRRRSGLPIAASEMLLTRQDYRSLLEAQATDYVMVDPTWNGGISETMRVAHQAQAYNLPVTMHDCTGPLTLFAGLHVCASVPNVALQETVRAHIRSFYSNLIDTNVDIRGGRAALPKGPGLGTRLNPELFHSGRVDYRRSGGLP